MRSSAIILILLAIVFFGGAPYIASAKDISGDIISDDIWTPANSPYKIIANTTIAPGITVTVEAGTSVILATDVILTINGILNSAAGSSFLFASNASIDVYGALNATGTSSNGIIFDSSAEFPAPGDWTGIKVYDGNASFTYSTIKHARDAISYSSYLTGSGSVILDHCKIIDNSGRGISMSFGTTATLDVTNCPLIARNGSGVDGGDGIALVWHQGITNITSNTIINNVNSDPKIQNSGIRIEGDSTNPTVSSNIISGNSIGITTVDVNNQLVIGGSPSTANSIFQNNRYGMLNLVTVTNVTPSLVNAANNWWGNSSGPQHITNPSGTGNIVSDYITFKPFLTTPPISGAIASIAPTFFDFGTTEIGAFSTPKTFIVSNVGSQQLDLGAVTINGANQSVFQVSANNCPASLAPGLQCTFSVTFTPTAKQSYSALVSLAATGSSLLPTYTASVSGTGGLSVSLPFAETFSSSILDSVWSIVNASPQTYSLIQSQGNLRISTQLNATFNSTTRNIFTVGLPPAISRMRVTAIVRVADTNYSSSLPQGGMAIIADSAGQPDFGNYVRTQFGYLQTNTHFNVQRSVCNNCITETQTTEARSLTPTISPIMLQLIKRGTNYESRYSTDSGTTYTSLGTDTLATPAAYAALFAYSTDTNRNATPIDFDSITIEALPSVSVPAAVAFASVPVSTVPAPLQNFTVSNTGAAPLTVSSAYLGGTDATRFTLGNSSCGDFPFTVPAGNFCILTVSMLTDVAGSYAANVVIVSNDIDTPTASVPVTGTVAPPAGPVNLTVDFSGNGGGSVSFNGGSAFNAKTTVIATIGSMASFTATPDQYSLFTGWSGLCAGATGCSFTTPGTNGNVTANFDRYTAHSVQLYPIGTYFPAITGIGSAYADPAAAGTAIRLWEADYTETLLFDLGKTVTIDGGYDGSFSNNSGTTTVKGAMTIKCLDDVTCGWIGAKNIIIRQPIQ